MSQDNLRIPSIPGGPGAAPLSSATPVQAKDPLGSLSNEEMAALKPQAGQGRSFKELLLEQSQPAAPVKFSSHASARLNSRKIEMGPDQMRQLSEAMDRAAAKGIDDTLILTKEAAFIVSAKNRTVVTAMDREQLVGNVFTNIEGAIIV